LTADHFQYLPLLLNIAVTTGIWQQLRGSGPLMHVSIIGPCIIFSIFLPNQQTVLAPCPKHISQWNWPWVGDVLGDGTDHGLVMCWEMELTKGWSYL